MKVQFQVFIYKSRVSEGNRQEHETDQVGTV